MVTEEMKQRGNTISGIRKHDLQSKLTARLRKRGLEGSSKIIQRSYKSDCFKAKFRPIIEELNEKLEKRKAEKALRKQFVGLGDEEKNIEFTKFNTTDDKHLDQKHAELVENQKHEDFKSIPHPKQEILIKDEKPVLSGGLGSNHEHHKQKSETMQIYGDHEMNEDKHMMNARRRKMSKDDMDIDNEKPRRNGKIRTKDDMNLKKRRGIKSMNNSGSSSESENNKPCKN